MAAQLAQLECPVPLATIPVKFVMSRVTDASDPSPPAWSAPSITSPREMEPPAPFAQLGNSALEPTPPALPATPLAVSVTEEPRFAQFAPWIMSLQEQDRLA